MSQKEPRVAIVHDILSTYGGAERVVEGLLSIWPDADIFTSRYNRYEPSLSAFNKPRIYTSFVQELPFYSFLSKFYTPLFPIVFESFDLSSYDIVISSTAHFAKAALTNLSQLHICYCHTPPRFLYQYPSESKSRNQWPFKPFVAVLDHLLRLYDYLIAQRPDILLTNSHTTAARIKKFYHRDAIVVYPPINIDKFKPSGSHTKDYFLVVSRLVTYKNIDTVVKVFQKRTEKLVIVGTGPELENLKSISTPNIEFCGYASDEELVEFYQNARAVIFSSSDEDFGIVPVESMAAGTPVIAYNSGGVTETVIDGKTGMFYDKNTPESLNEALVEFIDQESKFDQAEIVNHAQLYSLANFQSEIKKITDRKLTKT